MGGSRLCVYANQQVPFSFITAPFAAANVLVKVDTGMSVFFQS